jgi:hypothetical protein
MRGKYPLRIMDLYTGRVNTLFPPVSSVIVLSLTVNYLNERYWRYTEGMTNSYMYVETLFRLLLPATGLPVACLLQTGEREL